MFSRKLAGWPPEIELKSSPQEMAENYDLLSEDKRRHGSMSYADYPPVKMDNAITKVFDARFPRWRERANLPQPPRDTSEDAELLAEIKTGFEWLRKNAK